MERKIAISVENLSKTFRIPHEKSSSMKQAVVNLFRNKKGYSEFKVLKDISFKIYEGEFFGIVGRNGCGKSTLLKILAGIYTYDTGKLEIHGKISPFLELGVGFNPELTGKENIFLNGAILGLSRKEIEDKYEEIVVFSELQEFMDQRLKNYSSGMQVRLAFSVAIHAHAPIILLDEVLAVGDARFQKKCHGVFSRLKSEGRTIVFVSHSMDAVREFCDRAILLSEGEIIVDGNPRKASAEYERLNLELGKGDGFVEGNGGVKVTKVELFSEGKKTDYRVNRGRDLEVVMHYCNSLDRDASVEAEIGLYIDNTRIFFSNSEREGSLFKLKKGEGTVTLRIGNVTLLPNKYRITLSLQDSDMKQLFYGNHEVGYLDVVSDNDVTGVCELKHEWI